MMPFEHLIEATTFAPSSWSLPSLTCTVAFVPSTMPSVIPSLRSFSLYVDGTTWCLRMVFRSADFSGLSSPSTVPLGSLSKAAFVGANTVMGPGLETAST